MTKLVTKLFALLILLAAAPQINAQVKAGLRLGMSSTEVKVGDLFNDEGRNFAVTDANYSFHAGGFIQIEAGPIFIQPEAVFNSNRVTFQVDDFGNGIVGEAFSEKYNYLDIPIMTGLKLGPLRLQAGPVGHLLIGNESELAQNIPDYEANYKKLKVGFQTGIGLDIWKILIDLKYEGNFNQFGDDITIGGQQFEFSRNPSRLVATIGYAF